MQTRPWGWAPSWLWARNMLLQQEKAHRLLSGIRKHVASKPRKLVFPFCSALVRDTWWAQAWALQYNRDMHIGEQIHWGVWGTGSFAVWETERARSIYPREKARGESHQNDRSFSILCKFSHLAEHYIIWNKPCVVGRLSVSSMFTHYDTGTHLSGFLWALGHTGSVRDTYPVGSETEGQSTKYFVAFKCHCWYQTAIYSLDLCCSPMGRCVRKFPPQV